SQAAKIARKFLNREPRDFGAFCAAITLIRCGMASEGAMHLRTILEKDIWLEQDAPYPFADNATRAGLVLYLLANYVNDPALGLKLALQLQQQLQTGSSAWGSTQANAWATLGLAAYGAKFASRDCRGALRFRDGREIPLTGQCSLSQALARDSEVSLQNDGPGPLFYELTVSGIPQEMPSQPGQLLLCKTYLNAAGQPVTSARQGELLTVQLEIAAPGPRDNLVLCDLLPGGLEIEDEALATRAAAVPPALARTYPRLRPNYWEKGDDRILLFADWLEAGQDVFTYQVRAVSRGRFKIPPAHAEAMYSPDFSGYSREEDDFTID
ncbi:MAG: hypothetical protein GX564_02550, partial [Oligosphaeraceae bacterium]|nr:hypothetical protein [Oligosphaeraceae bacterium]